MRKPSKETRKPSKEMRKPIVFFCYIGIPAGWALDLGGEYILSGEANFLEESKCWTALSIEKVLHKIVNIFGYITAVYFLEISPKCNGAQERDLAFYDRTMVWCDKHNITSGIIETIQVKELLKEKGMQNSKYGMQALQRMIAPLGLKTNTRSARVYKREVYALSMMYIAREKYYKYLK